MIKKRAAHCSARAVRNSRTKSTSGTPPRPLTERQVKCTHTGEGRLVQMFRCYQYFPDDPYIGTSGDGDGNHRPPGPMSSMKESRKHRNKHEVKQYLVKRSLTNWTCRCTRQRSSCELACPERPAYGIQRQYKGGKSMVRPAFYQRISFCRCLQPKRERHKAH